MLSTVKLITSVLKTVIKRRMRLRRSPKKFRRSLLAKRLLPMSNIRLLMLLTHNTDPVSTSSSCRPTPLLKPLRVNFKATSLSKLSSSTMKRNYQLTQLALTLPSSTT